jgi:hypothetical protein
LSTSIAPSAAPVPEPSEARVNLPAPDPTESTADTSVPVPTGAPVSVATEYPINLAVDEPTGAAPTLFMRPVPAHATRYTVFFYFIVPVYISCFLSFFIKR